MSEDNGDAIIHDVVYPHPIERVWRALTTSEALAEWLMPNDFAPEVGHRFTFRTGPEQGWNGVVDCQVMELDPPHRVSYTWRGGILPETRVTFTLEPIGQQTRLRLEHTGFAAGGGAAQTVRERLGSGWRSRVLSVRLPTLLAREAGEDGPMFACEDTQDMPEKTGDRTMIRRTLRVTIVVRDQDAALRFYTEKLGFEMRADNPMGPNARWLTVAPPEDRVIEFVLQPPDWFQGEEREAKLRQVGRNPTTVFEVDDCRTTYEALRERGVTFYSPPEDLPYGVQAVAADLDGNSLVLLQPAAGAPQG
jgi:uncharacterized protein YndB with AHSA1/START domain/catechol 2,3-dioxygenase-like lactoylglutathione lyase family enzyme